MMRDGEKFKRKVYLLQPYKWRYLDFFRRKIDYSAYSRFAHQIRHFLGGPGRRRNYADVDAVVGDYLLERVYVVNSVAVVDHSDLMTVVVEDRDDFKAVLRETLEVQKSGPQITRAYYGGLVCLIQAEYFAQNFFKVEYVISFAFLAEFTEKRKVFTYLSRFYVERLAYGLGGDIEGAAVVY